MISWKTCPRSKTDSQIKEGATYTIHVSGGFKHAIDLSIGYLKTFPSTKKLSRISVDQAIKAGSDLVDRQNHLASAVEDINGIKNIYSCKNNYKFVELVSEQSIKREGKFMQHCAGSDTQNYINDVRNHKIKLFSLRDSNNNPHCTIEYIVHSTG